MLVVFSFRDAMTFINIRVQILKLHNFVKGNLVSNKTEVEQRLHL